MYLIEYLKSYKEEFINIGINNNQKRFLQDSFIKWYINCKKIGYYEIFPASNIFTYENHYDLLYANLNKNTNFDINYVNKKTKELYNTYAILCKDLIDVVIEPGFLNTENRWMQTKKVLNRSQAQRVKRLYCYNYNNNCYNYNNNYHKDEAFIRNYYFEQLICLYEFIEVNNTVNLSMPPIFKGIELFGSCVNTHNTEFCSLFKIEKYFGSLGSFWDYNFHKSGIYLCNPPFDMPLIERMALKLIANLISTKYEVVIIITIPVWDSPSQKSIGSKDFKMGFEGYDKLVNNDFLMEKNILDKNVYKYWDYCTKQKVASSHTHLIILSNLSHLRYKKVFNLDNFVKAWREF